MCKTVTVIFMGLAMIGNSVAIAEPAAVAYASYNTSKHNSRPGSSLDDMDVVLQQNMYEIQQDASKIKLHVNSPVGDIWVKFEDFAGDFTMLGNDSDRNVASIEVNAKSMRTSRGMVGMLLKSKGFLDVANFPSMKFVGSSFEWFSERQAILKGDMTIKDVTRQIVFYIELDDSNEENAYSDRVMLQARATIKRSEFGINTLLPLVSDDVKLHISINAVKKKGPAERSNPALLSMSGIE